MKTLLKVLTPTISTIGIATISLTSCGTTSADGYTAIPTSYLKISSDGKTLEGFKEPTEQIKGYDKLTVPKAIENVELIYHGGEGRYIAYDSVKKIDFESGSNWKTITSIANLTELKILVLPPNLNASSDDMILNCKKLDTIDLSNVKDLTCLSSIEWIYCKDGVINGTLIVPKGKKSIGNTIKDNNSSIKNWTVEEK